MWLHSFSSDNSLLFINSRLMPLPRTYKWNIFTILHVIRMLRIVIYIISRDLLVLIVWAISSYSYLSVWNICSNYSSEHTPISLIPLNKEYSFKALLYYVLPYISPIGWIVSKRETVCSLTLSLTLYGFIPLLL